MAEITKHVNIYRFDAKNINNLQSESDVVTEEVAVALVYNGISHAVMMATPKDLNYFAIGFSLAEGIIQDVGEIYGIHIVEQSQGIEVHIELSSRRFSELKEKRRSMAGRTGCGICGTEQINNIFSTTLKLPYTQHIQLADFTHSLKYLKQVQEAGALTGCTHAAVWLDLSGHFIAGFEDIGRHVALDKLLGFRAKQTNQDGVILVSSRASYEMVQKSSNCGVEILISVSATTSLAIDKATESRLTLISFFKGEKGIIYTNPSRIS